MTMSDADLVHAVRTGWREAYDELIRRYAGRVRSACFARVGVRGPVDDLAADAFLRALRAINTLSNPDLFGNWLHGIAVKTCLDWIKAPANKQVPFSVLDSTGETLGNIPGPLAARPEELEERQRLWREIEALPEIYRETLVMFYFDELSYVDIGATLGVTPAAINARLTKARAMLRRRLTPGRTP